MTDKPIPPKGRRSTRKGVPPTPTETLGALASSTESAALAPPSATEKPAARVKPVTPPAAKAAKRSPSKTPAPEAPKKPVSERTKPLNFRVTNEFRKAFKQAAATEDCKKVELLERIFAAWQSAKATS